jgi:hypothetical protein
MYCSNCGEKKAEDSRFCFNCGNQLTKNISIINSIKVNKKARKWLIINFIATYCFLFMLLAYRGWDPYYYVSFFPYGLLQALMVLSAISIAFFSYKLSTSLEKPTFLIITYTLCSPFILLNFIPLIGLLADSKKKICRT